MDTIRVMSECSQQTDQTLREAIGRLTYLALYLRRSNLLQAVPREHWESLSDLLVDVPIQAPNLGKKSAPAQWLQLASLAELHGFAPLARIIVDGLSSHSNGNGEVFALCAAQRGRIARSSGDLSDAIFHYKDAIRHSSDNASSDAWPRAHCGLANVFADRGNFPAAEKYFRKALRHGPRTDKATRVYAWMGLAMVRRKRGDLLDAMLSAWTAFDLTDERSPVRSDLLVTLAECAIELGDFPAAINGFESALEKSPSLRITIASMTGLVLCYTRQFRQVQARDRLDSRGAEFVRNRVLSSLHAIQSVLDAAPAQQRTFAMLACADAWTILDRKSRNDLAERLNLWIETSRSLIEAFGYHEYRLLEETISTRVAKLVSTDVDNQANEPEVPTNPRSTSHLVLTRLRTFTITDRSAFATQ